MKYNAIELIRRGANALNQSGDEFNAYALHELANNFIGVMNGENTLDEWREIYTAGHCFAYNLDHLFPPRPDSVSKDDDEKGDER